MLSPCNNCAPMNAELNRNTSFKHFVITDGLWHADHLVSMFVELSVAFNLVI